MMLIRNREAKVLLSKPLKTSGRRVQINSWTYRHGKTLDEAVEFCRKNGLNFMQSIQVLKEKFSIRKHNPENWMQTGLLMTEIWRFSGWGEIYNIIQERIEFRVEGKEVLAYSKLKKEKKKDYSGRIEIKM
jgi:hypothetical protein